nr:RPA-interacting protein B [Ipomoea trifida]
MVLLKLSPRLMRLSGNMMVFTQHIKVIVRKCCWKCKGYFMRIFGWKKQEKLLAEQERSSTSWEDEEDDFLARAVYDHMNLNDEQVAKEVWCPICKHGELKENRHLISCTQCGVTLDRGDEVNLEVLRNRLAEAHSEHLDRGCRLKPEFCVETKFGLSAFYIRCEPCNTFEIVI